MNVLDEIRYQLTDLEHVEAFNTIVDEWQSRGSEVVRLKNQLNEDIIGREVRLNAVKQADRDAQLSFMKNMRELIPAAEKFLDGEYAYYRKLQTVINKIKD